MKSSSSFSLSYEYDAPRLLEGRGSTSRIMRNVFLTYVNRSLFSCHTRYIQLTFRMASLLYFCETGVESPSGSRNVSVHGEAIEWADEKGMRDHVL